MRGKPSGRKSSYLLNENPKSSIRRSNKEGEKKSCRPKLDSEAAVRPSPLCHRNHYQRPIVQTIGEVGKGAQGKKEVGAQNVRLLILMWKGLRERLAECLKAGEGSRQHL